MTRSADAVNEVARRCPNCLGARYSFTETFDVLGVHLPGEHGQPVDVSSSRDLATRTTSVTRRICADCRHVWTVVTPGQVDDAGVVDAQRGE